MKINDTVREDFLSSNLKLRIDEFETTLAVLNGIGAYSNY